MSNDQNVARQPTGAAAAAGGQYATTDRPEATGVDLAAPPAAAFIARVPIAAVVKIGREYYDELPTWPEGLDKPEVSYEYSNGMVESYFTFDGGAQSVTFWTAGDEGYNTQHDDYGNTAITLFEDDGDEYAAMQWMQAVHDRIDGEAYSVSIAAQTSAVEAAVVAAALGQVQPTWASHATTVGAMARVETMLTVFDTAAAGIEFGHEPGETPDPDECTSAVHDVLVDFRHWAKANGVDFDEVVQSSATTFDSEQEIG